MFNEGTTFIGIDPTAGIKPFAYVALGADLRPLAIGQGSLEEVLAFAAGQRSAVLAICAPRRPNIGLMRRPEVRERLSPAPNPGRWMDFRMAEYLLRQHNLSIPQTPCDIEACPNWMKMGFQLFRRVEAFGYHTYPHDSSALQVLEVYPHASYAVLLGVLPFPKYTLEGRIQRQLLLHDRGLKVPDPMNFFEEITRHKLLHGILPKDYLYSAGELDAAVGAYTAYLAALQPDELCLLGDPDEGQLALPAASLKPAYN